MTLANKEKAYEQILIFLATLKDSKRYIKNNYGDSEIATYLEEVESIINILTKIVKSTAQSI